MEVEGKVIAFLGERTGVSKAGKAWKVKEYVLETKDNFPRKIAFDFFGERADQFNLAIGDDIKLSFDIESREYQGRWFTSIRGWNCEKLSAAPAAPAAPAADPFTAGGAAFIPPTVSSNAEDLPF